MEEKHCAACGRPERKTRPLQRHPTTGEWVCSAHRAATPCAHCHTVQHTSGHCGRGTFWASKE